MAALRDCMPAGGAATDGCVSSGDSTVDSPSTPFASAGSGALRQACDDKSACAPWVETTDIPAYLDEVFSLGFGHQRLKLGGSEGIDQTRFRHDEQEHLGAGKNREFVRLAMVSESQLN